jgi:hypothetical protein
VILEGPSDLKVSILHLIEDARSSKDFFIILERVGEIHTSARMHVAEEHADDPEKAAELYLLTAGAFWLSAELTNRNEVSEMFKDNEVQCQREARSLYMMAVESSLNQARRLVKEEEHEEAEKLYRKAGELERLVSDKKLMEREKELISDFVMENMGLSLRKAEATAITATARARSWLTKIGDFFKGRESELEEITLEHAKKEEKELLPIPGEKIEIKNDFRKVGKGWYRWSVYLEPKEGNQAVLDEVDHVTYTLHPTFPNPVQEVYDRESKFGLTATGWGEFEIKAAIHFKNGDVVTKYHYLDLGISKGVAEK